MTELLSVCLASYNGEEFIEDQINSILDSALVSELLVSDDGSTDNTINILKEISNKDCRLKILKGPRLGLVKNFEFLIKQAKGDYIFLSDQDDIWMRNKVPVMLQALKKYDLVVSDCIIVDKHENVLFPSFFSRNPPRKNLFKNLIQNSYLGCCMGFRKSLVSRALPFPQKIPSHDWWLGLIAGIAGSVSFINTPLIKYRRHDKNVSSTSGPSKNSLYTKIYLRASIFYKLCARAFRIYIYDSFTKNN
jgi:glycosyltransferase involved in cell wall biosynthesis